MSSPTLGHIMKHLTNPDIPDTNYIDFPFNVERFCRENDEELEALRAQYVDQRHAYNEIKKSNGELARQLADADAVIEGYADAEVFSGQAARAYFKKWNI